MGWSIAWLTLTGRQIMAESGRTLLKGLTRREWEVSRLLCQGCAAKHIAAELGLSVHTVRRHLEHIYKKLDAQCRTVAVLRILEAARGDPPRASHGSQQLPGPDAFRISA